MHFSSIKFYSILFDSDQLISIQFDVDVINLISVHLSKTQFIFWIE